MKLLKFEGKAIQENGRDLTLISLVIDKRLSKEEFDKLRMKVVFELLELDRVYPIDSEEGKDKAIDKATEM